MLLFSGIQVKDGKREKYKIHTNYENLILALQFLEKNEFFSKNQGPMI